MRLDDLIPVFGGHIRELGGRRWLDTHVGGLRTFVICREGIGGGRTFDLAVFTPDTRELDPFFANDEGCEWQLKEAPQELPRLRAGFVFAGCRRGILFASNTGEPALESMVSTLWDLAGWARKPWIPPVAWSQELMEFQGRERSRRKRARVVRDRWVRVTWVLVVIAIVLWLRAGTGWALLALLAALAAYPHTVEDVGVA